MCFFVELRCTGDRDTVMPTCTLTGFLCSNLRPRKICDVSRKDNGIS